METNIKIVEIESFEPKLQTDQGTIYGPRQYQATVEIFKDQHRVVELSQDVYSQLTNIALGV